MKLARQAPQQFDLCSGTYIRDFSAYPELLEAREAAQGVLDAAIAAYMGTSATSSSAVAVASGAAWAIAHGLARLLLEQALRPGKDGLPGENVFVRQALHIFTQGISASQSARTAGL